MESAFRTIWILRCHPTVTQQCHPTVKFIQAKLLVFILIVLTNSFRTPASLVLNHQHFCDFHQNIAAPFLVSFVYLYYAILAIPILNFFLFTCALTFIFLCTRFSINAYFAWFYLFSCSNIENNVRFLIRYPIIKNRLRLYRKELL